MYMKFIKVSFTWYTDLPMLISSQSVHYLRLHWGRNNFCKITQVKYKLAILCNILLLCALFIFTTASFDRVKTIEKTSLITKLCFINYLNFFIVIDTKLDKLEKQNGEITTYATEPLLKQLLTNKFQTENTILQGS